MVIMRFIKFVTYIFYKYYSDGATKSVAYTKTIASMVVLIVINLWILLIMFNLTDFIPITTNDKKEIRYLKIALYTLPIFLFFIIFIKEKDLKLITYDEIKIKRGGTFLIIYLVASVVLLFTLMFVFAKA